MSDERDVKLNVTARAAEKITQMAQHVQDVGTFYEQKTQLRTAESFANVVAGLFRLGGDIWAEGPDGDLSLGGRTESGFTYGVVAFPFEAESRLPDAPKPVAWSIHS